jgi:MFS family permease
MRRWVLVVLCLVQFVDVLGVTSATTAIPAMIEGLGLEPSAAGLIATMYAMFFGGLLVLGARLGDRYGHRRILLIGILLFAAVSIVGGTANELVQLLTARAAQGAAAAISVPSALRLLNFASAEGKARTSALAAWSAVGAMAGATGFLVGGVLAQARGWRAVFWVNAPIGVLLAVGVVTLVPVLPPQDRGEKLDISGAALLIGAVMGIVFGCSLLETTSSRPAGVGTIAAGLVLGVAFVVRQRHAATPLIPLDAFRSANLRVGTIVSFVNTAATSSSAVLATLFLQDRLGASPVAAGLTLMALSVAAIAGSASVRPLSSRLDSRWLAALGLAGSAAGILNTGAQVGTALGTAFLVVVASFNLRPIPGTAVAWALAAVGAGATAVWLAFKRDLPDGLSAPVQR